MTDQEALAAGNRAVLAAGAGNVGLARYLSSARVVWRRRDALGHHVELQWRPSRETLEHIFVSDAEGPPSAYLGCQAVAGAV